MPFFGIYVVMFIDVSYTFMKVSVVVLLFIFAFSLGFFVLLSLPAVLQQPDVCHHQDPDHDERGDGV